MTFMRSLSQLTFLANSTKLVRFTIIIPDHRQMNASKTERMKKSFARIGISIWNSTPYSVKSAYSILNTNSETKLNKYFLKL